MSKHLSNPLVWLHGLFAAFIGGGANALAAAIIDPAAFNIHEGLRKLLSLALASGMISAAMYLKQSPLPPIVDERKPRRAGPLPLPLLLLPLLLAGCMVVPATKIKYDPATKQFVIRSPKDIEIENLKASVAGDKAEVTIGKYKAANNSATVNAVARQNAQAIAAMGQLGEKLIEEAAKKAP